MWRATAGSRKNSWLCEHAAPGRPVLGTFQARDKRAWQRKRAEPAFISGRQPPARAHCSMDKPALEAQSPKHLYWPRGLFITLKDHQGVLSNRSPLSKVARVYQHGTLMLSRQSFNRWRTAMSLSPVVLCLLSGQQHTGQFRPEHSVSSTRASSSTITKGTVVRKKSKVWREERPTRHLGWVQRNRNSGFSEEAVLQI